MCLAVAPVIHAHSGWRGGEAVELPLPQNHVLGLAAPSHPHHQSPATACVDHVLIPEPPPPAGTSDRTYIAEHIVRVLGVDATP